MRALGIIVPILCILTIAYRYYSSFTAAISIFFILIVALAGLGIVVVNALAESAWATFTIFTTVPLALFMGFYMFRWRRGRVQEATVVGIVVLALAVIF